MTLKPIAIDLSDPKKFNMQYFRRFVSALQEQHMVMKMKLNKQF